MPESRPAGVSMYDLLAACAAADAISRPPGAGERPEGPRPRAGHPPTAPEAHPATTAPRTTADPARPPSERPAA